MRHFFFSAAINRNDQIAFVNGKYNSPSGFPSIDTLLGVLKEGGINGGRILSVLEFSTENELNAFMGNQPNTSLRTS